LIPIVYGPRSVERCARELGDPSAWEGPMCITVRPKPAPLRPKNARAQLRAIEMRNVAEVRANSWIAQLVKRGLYGKRGC
jgi:hypothetical protein